MRKSIGFSPYRDGGFSTSARRAEVARYLGGVHFAAIIALFAAAPAEADQGNNGTYPTLTPFYRETQLQGHLFGMGLMKIPPYVTDSTIAFPYKTKVGFSEEIPFTDSFSINRILGGYPLSWLERFHLVKPELGRASLDYAVSAPNGLLQYQTDLIKARLAPYLDAGYRPADITLALDNIPWDLATPNGAPPQEGPWGRKTPPGDWKQWSDVVSHFTVDLKSYLGAAASQITFETGIEYNIKASFDGDQEDFFKYYEVADEAVHKILPDASFHPGEFAGTGECNAAKAACSYDVREFLMEAARDGIEPHVVPRSLQLLATTPNSWPSSAAQAMRTSFARLKAGTASPIPEIHQFGLLFQPFGKSYGRDPGAMQASWEFQTLMLLIENGPPARVYHWAAFESVGGHQILNGSGFDMLVLDHYLGYQIIPLQVRQLQTGASRSESLAVEFRANDDDAVVVSNFTSQPDAGATALGVRLPASWSTARGVKAVEFSAGSDIFSVIKADLAKAGNLKPEFSNCEFCEGTPAAMAIVPQDADRLIRNNWQTYVGLMSRQLHWNGPSERVSIQNGEMTLSLATNAVVVLSPNNE